MSVSSESRFKIAAYAYLVYGVLYLAGAVFLVSRGIGIRGDSGLGAAQSLWFLLGLVFVVLFPWLISKGAEGRGYLWFTRVLAVLVTYRALEIAQIAAAPEIETITLSGDLVLPFSLAAWGFFLVTLTTATVLGWASFLKTEEPQ